MFKISDLSKKVNNIFVVRNFPLPQFLVGGYQFIAQF